MIKTKIKTLPPQDVEEIVDIICNKCGESCQTGKIGDSASYDGLLEVAITGGYHSKFLGDCTTHKFSICEKCLNDYFKTFKIKPTSEYNA